MWILLVLLLATPAAAVQVTSGDVWVNQIDVYIRWDFSGENFRTEGDSRPVFFYEGEPGARFPLEFHSTTVDGVTRQSHVTADGQYPAELMFQHAAPCLGCPPEWERSLPFAMTGFVDVWDHSTDTLLAHIPLTGHGTLDAKRVPNDPHFGTTVFYHYQFSAAAVPEPGTFALLSLGLGWVAWRRRQSGRPLAGERRTLECT